MISGDIWVWFWTGEKVKGGGSYTQRAKSELNDGCVLTYIHMYTHARIFILFTFSGANTVTGWFFSSRKETENRTVPHKHKHERELIHISHNGCSGQIKSRGTIEQILCFSQHHPKIWTYCQMVEQASFKGQYMCACACVRVLCVYLRGKLEEVSNLS